MNGVLTVGLSRQIRIVSALTIREIRVRNSKRAFMQLFDLAEAVIFILVHWAIFAFMHRRILVGDSLLLFIATGVLPVLYFRSITQRTASSIEAAKTVTNIPLIEPIDYSIARSFVEFLSFTIIFSLFFVMMATFSVSKYSLPFNPLAVAQFVILITLFGFGVGLINSFLIFLWPMWKMCWSFISRVQILFAAVFYIPEYMSPEFKQYLVYSPIMHFVALFRSGFYPTYPTHLLSMTYIIQCTGGVLLVGLALERALRSYRAGT